MGDVTITIPAEHAERFHIEAEWGVEAAADNLAESLRFLRQKRDPQGPEDEKRPADPGRVAEERSRLAEAYRLFDQAGPMPFRANGELVVEADADTIGHAMRGCLMHAAEDAHEKSQDMDGTAVLPALADELKFWTVLADQYETRKAAS